MKASRENPPKELKTPREKNAPAFVEALKGRIGTCMLYVKDKAEKDSCEVDVLRCVLYHIETKVIASKDKESVEHKIVLFPDTPHFRKALRGGTTEVGAVWGQRIPLDGPTAERCLLLSYDGLDDAIWDRLGDLTKEDPRG